MPQMDGVEYLKKNYKSGHPKVVVVSSASREDTRYAQETLNNGASDFVEKPALNNLAERADEIKNKIKMSFLNSSPSSHRVDLQFAKDFKIERCETKARAFLGSFSDKDRIKSAIQKLKNDQPPLFIFFEGSSNFLSMFKDELKLGHKVELFEDEVEFKPKTVYLCDFNRDFSARLF